MAIVKPFKAVRATRDKVGLVSSRSYEDYTPAELGAQLDFNPYSFLHIINQGYKHQREVSDTIRFGNVHKKYKEFKEQEIFIKDKKPAFYIYKKITPQHTFCGIIAATSIEDYLNNTIKKHEGTLHKREELFENYLKATGFNTEPVLLTYPDNDEIQSIIQKYESRRAEYEFTSNDKKSHLLWVVDELNDIEEIEIAFGKVESIYIADGHHRSASSHLLLQDFSKNSENHTGDEPYNFFMSFLIPESNLKISEFNRLITDLNGLSTDEFLEKLSEWFIIENLGQQLFKPDEMHTFSMYLENDFYKLSLKKEHYKFTDPLSELDPQILFDTVLNPILGIEDLRYDTRISYFNGKNDGVHLKNGVDTGEYKVAFGLFPVSVKQLKQIADANLQMPPKSTYIEPKLRSGITIYEFTE
ncbi:DUF1015 domain-containing protein [Aureivirga sp. CE67]|uniref:DUF1015 domain-containing protein n=1 Tax=Aureivirga sp. CE67 TaxID=1788983 RepID=UPI0018CBD1BC|nr:DUF1015 domain-containing protein [Aureivirga sp. CE67]